MITRSAHDVSDIYCLIRTKLRNEITKSKIVDMITRTNGLFHNFHVLLLKQTIPL